MPRLRKVARYEYRRRTSPPFDDDSSESESEGGPLDYNDASDVLSQRDDEEADTEPVADTSGPGFCRFTTASSTNNATTGRSFEDHDAHDENSETVDEEDADVIDTNFGAVDHDAVAELFDMVERDIRSRVEAGSSEPAQGVVDSLQSDADDDDQEEGEDFVHLSGESRQGGQDENGNGIIDLTQSDDDEDQEEDEEVMEEEEIGDREDNEDGDDTEIGVWRGIVVVRCYRDGEHTLHVESDNNEGELLEDRGARHEYSDDEDEEDDDASGANSEDNNEYAEARSAAREIIDLSQTDEEEAGGSAGS